ncbi:hypothetical protein RUM44_004349 [Polyplax serrata]|uniref:Uncharacterized protein n=1 Tax=Polyplax serrata TaxID=468196 RepID=A0ABR1B2L7_POLSC
MCGMVRERERDGRTDSQAQKHRFIVVALEDIPQAKKSKEDEKNSQMTRQKGEETRLVVICGKQTSSKRLVNENHKSRKGCPEQHREMNLIDIISESIAVCPQGAKTCRATQNLVVVMYQFEVEDRPKNEFIHSFDYLPFN